MTGHPRETPRQAVLNHCAKEKEKEEVDRDREGEQRQSKTHLVLTLDMPTGGVFPAYLGRNFELKTNSLLISALPQTFLLPP